MANAVEYAESLGVHTVWEKVESDLASLENVNDNIADLRRKLSVKRHEIEQREIEVAGEVMGETHTSKTAAKEAVKEAISTDADLRVKRLALKELQDSMDEQEDNKSFLQRSVHAGSSRMEELGGLLRLYAAAKYATQQVGTLTPAS